MFLANREFLPQLTHAGLDESEARACLSKFCEWVCEGTAPAVGEDLLKMWRGLWHQHARRIAAEWQRKAS
jgi:hypothetical protein